MSKFHHSLLTINYPIFSKNKPETIIENYRRKFAIKHSLFHGFTYTIVLFTDQFYTVMLLNVRPRTRASLSLKIKFFSYDFPLLSYIYHTHNTSDTRYVGTFPTQEFSATLAGVLQFKPVLTLSTWRQHRFPRLRTQSYKTVPTSDTNYMSRLPPMLMANSYKSEFSCWSSLQNSGEHLR